MLQPFDRLEDSPYFDDEVMIAYDEYWAELIGDAWATIH